jgi:peptide/nickel transport system permease protein
MGRYIARRLVQMLPVALGVTLAVFFMMRLIPGDPAAIILGDRATDERIANLQHNLGLDQPVYVQYVLFMGRLARGDLGNSLLHRMPVLDLVSERLPVTALLVFYAALISVVITIPTGLLSALKRDTMVDQAIRGTFLMGLAMPNFWVGLLLVLVFSLQLGWFPVSGYGISLREHIWHLTLPAITITLRLATMLTRSLRSSLLETMAQPHVTVGRAKGLTSRQVLVRHVLRNSLISTVTILGINIGWMLGGSVVIETVFNVPGLGSLMIHAIYARDFPLVQGITLVYGVLVIVLNLATDIIYGLLDPRVAYD